MLEPQCYPQSPAHCGHIPTCPDPVDHRHQQTCPGYMDEWHCHTLPTAHNHYDHNNGCPMPCQPHCSNGTIICGNYNQAGCMEYECAESCPHPAYDMYGCALAEQQEPDYDPETQYLCPRQDGVRFKLKIMNDSSVKVSNKL